MSASRTQPESQLPRLRAFLRAHPWAILPEALDLVVEIVERRAQGIRLSDEEIEAQIGAARRVPQPSAALGSIAVLPIHGLISHRINLATDISGGTSVEGFGRAFGAAVADPNISAVVLDVDSPGGSVFGVQELADQIHAARGPKPIVAVANATAASAAYWLAAQADELVVTPSGEVGSIGVLAIHDDLSKAAELQGVKRTYVTAGRFKAEGNPTEPLGDEARTNLQGRVDAYYSDFVRAVARGRGASQTKVRDEWGQGRTVSAKQAVELGMADRLGTFDETIGRIASKLRRSSGARADAVPGGFVAVEQLGSEPIMVATTPEAEERERLSLQLELAKARRA